MLILTRKANESIVIGNDVVVKVMRVHGNQVQLGISAPSDIPVCRYELYEDVKEENIQAAQEGRRAKGRLAQSLKELTDSGSCSEETAGDREQHGADKVSASQNDRQD